jgi:MFS family permease
VATALTKKTRVSVLTAALLAVFLGALDALIIGAAMPTIIADLGVATSSQQFARTLGGTIGIGFSGALVSHYLDKSINSLLNSPLRSEIPANIASQLSKNLQEFLRPEVVESLSSTALVAIRTSIGEGVKAVFWTALLVSFLSIIMCKMMPERKVVQ